MNTSGGPKDVELLFVCESGEEDSLEEEERYARFEYL